MFIVYFLYKNVLLTNEDNSRGGLTVWLLGQAASLSEADPKTQVEKEATPEINTGSRKKSDGWEGLIENRGHAYDPLPQQAVKV